ncbi:MAG: acetolactate synthase small subunit [Deltaproteobacteria bacterium RBG_13_65_10]|jgi:acetolactate synthase-1/3 small subunit|nr:MAG: acetolactate synthase small subunit [Deltaproteobacteria bacterium RBG_13_65_10]
MRRTISVVVENEAGVLARIANLFSGRGYNIDSLNVAETLDPSVSCMTIVTHGSDAIIEQITKQLHKLINVIKVTDLTEADHVSRELVLIKVTTEPSTRAEVLRVVDIFRGKVVDVQPKSFTIEVTGGEKKIEGVLSLLRPLGIKEIVRTGKVAIARGS